MPGTGFKRFWLAHRGVHRLDDTIANSFVRPVPHTPFGEPKQGALEISRLISDCREKTREERYSFQFLRILDVDTICLRMNEEKSFCVAMCVIGCAIWELREPRKLFQHFRIAQNQHVVLLVDGG